MCLVATNLDPAAAGVEATRVCQSHVAPIELVLEHPFLSEQTRAAFHVGISHPKSFCSCSLSAACSSAYGTRGCAEGRPSPVSRRMLYSRAVVLRVAYRADVTPGVRTVPDARADGAPNAVADATDVNGSATLQDSTVLGYVSSSNLGTFQIISPRASHDNLI